MKIVFFLMIFLSHRGIAEPFHIFPLKSDQSVSELLYEDLEIRPIYGRERILSKVLRFNGLSLIKSKSLPSGYKVKVPTRFLKDMVPNSEVKNNNISKSENLVPKENKILHRNLFFLGAGSYFLSGDSKNRGSFSGSGYLLGLDYSHLFSNDYGSLRSTFKFDSANIKSPEINGFLSNYAISIEPLKTLSNAFKLGVGGEIAREFILLISPDGEQQVQYALFPKVFIASEYLIKEFLILNLNLGLSLPYETNNQLKTASRPFGDISLIYGDDSMGWLGRLQAGWEARNVSGFEQSYKRLTMSLGKSF